MPGWLLGVLHSSAWASHARQFRHALGGQVHLWALQTTSLLFKSNDLLSHELNDMFSVL